jgi:hypothetical protein
VQVGVDDEVVLAILFIHRGGSSALKCDPPGLPPPMSGPETRLIERLGRCGLAL